jgi:hypothetical protein
MTEEITERKFRVQWGLVGGENHSSHFGPIYTVRRAAMAVAHTAAKNYQKAGNEDQAQKCVNIREALLYPTGTLLDGLCVRYRDGERTFYIAIVPEGGSWDTARMTVTEPGPMDLHWQRQERPASVPVGTRREFPRTLTNAELRVEPDPEPVNPAALIADKMAKAARKAVENGD